MTATESKCPHCNGSLERWEDPKAVLIITTLTAERDRLREALEVLIAFIPDGWSMPLGYTQVVAQAQAALK